MSIDLSGVARSAKHSRRAIRSLAILGALALMVPGSSGTAGPYTFSGSGKDDAKDVLMRYLERGKLVAMTAIIEQPIQPRSSQTMQVKLLQDNGKRRTTILQPLSLQGRTSIIDKERWINYYPDERRMLIQQAPEPSNWESPKERMGLASKNYAFELAKSQDIAGRKSFLVVATPKASEMPTRRYSIDASKYVLLKLETRAGNDFRVLYDTKAIDFPTNPVNEAYFELKPLGDVQVVKLSPPKPVSSGMDVKGVLGFQPIMPRSLPFGFMSRNPELTGDDDCRMLAIQITDGLANATVYQFSSSLSSGIPEPFEVSLGGFRIRLVSDLPGDVGHKLLDAFLREANKVLSTFKEPSLPSGLLDRTRTQAPRKAGLTLGRSEPIGEAPMEMLLMALMTAFQRACEDF